MENPFSKEVSCLPFYKMSIQGSPLFDNLERAVLNLDGVEIVVAKNTQKKKGFQDEDVGPSLYLE